MAPGSGSWKRFDHALAIGQDRVFVLDQIVRRQPALTLAHAHGSTRGMEAHTQLTGSVDLVVETGAVGEQVQVIRHRGGTAQDQLGQRSQRADPDGVRVHLCPDRVQQAQPVEQPQSGAGPDGPRE